MNATITVLKPNAAELINQEIQSKGFKKKYIAKQLGITPVTFSRHLSSNINLSVEFVLKVAKIINAPYDIFLQ